MLFITEDQERKNEKRNLDSTKRGVDVRFLSLGDSVIFIILLFSISIIFILFYYFYLYFYIILVSWFSPCVHFGYDFSVFYWMSVSRISGHLFCSLSICTPCDYIHIYISLDTTAFMLKVSWREGFILENFFNAGKGSWEWSLFNLNYFNEIKPCDLFDSVFHHCCRESD